MPNIIAWPLDILTRVTKNVRATVDQQALVAVYPSDLSDAVPKAVALGNGREFPDINAGASGLGYTVLTRGLVCFGTPRDGNACFLAAPDFRLDANNASVITIKRGTVETGDDGNPVLQWRDVGGGVGLVALTFAGAAFHAVYCEESGYGPSRIETSFDGKSWYNQVDVFPQGTFDSGLSLPVAGGAVAFNGEPDTTAGLYASVGYAAVEAPDDDPVWTDRKVSNIAWATAVGPPPPDPEGDPPPITHLAWSYGSNADPRKNPGVNTAAPGLLNQAGTSAGGKEIFAAATYERELKFVEFGAFGRQLVAQTAAVATSLNGSLWENHKLEGVQEGFWEPSVEPLHDRRGSSHTLAVAFIRNKEAADSYFVCATYNFYVDQTVDELGNIWGTIHRSTDGKNWTLAQSFGAKGDLGTNYYCFSLSAVAADLDTTTIVNL